VTTFGKSVAAALWHCSYQDEPGMDPNLYTSRWGDYSATSVDPSDPNSFWTIQMYPSGPAAWSTQITQILTVPSPVRLTVCLIGNEPGGFLARVGRAAPVAIHSQCRSGFSVVARNPDAGHLGQRYVRAVARHRSPAVLPTGRRAISSESTPPPNLNTIGF